jgi:hypothetical protein
MFASWDRNWERRRVVFSPEILGFAKLNDEVMVDVIKMSDIESVVEIEAEIDNISTISWHWNEVKGKFKSKKKDSDAFSDKMNLFRNSFKIETSAEGYNTGRTYYLQCETKQSCSETAQFLKQLVRKARFKSGDASCISLSRLWVRNCIHSEVFKTISALAVVAVLSARCSFSCILAISVSCK